jgi:hypothetical protein
MKIGVTGHRNFDDPSAPRWVEHSIREQLSHYGDFIGLTSLAKGADQIFAREALQLGGTLEAILPFPEYGESFDDPDESAGFHELIIRCSKVTTLAFSGSKDESYLAAGKYVADHSELLIAVWDGKPAAGLGGTGDVVAYALRNNKKVFQINPSARTALEIR